MPRKYNATWRTAMALHRALKSGVEYTASEIRDVLDGNGSADARYLSPAAKWLRDRGIPVATRKAGPASTWFEATTVDQMETYGNRVIEEAYSEIISLGRSCHLLAGPGSRIVKRRLRRCAIELGEHLGLEVDEVIAELAPLHAASVNGAA
jgi:hypothetical protein